MEVATNLSPGPASSSALSRLAGNLDTFLTLLTTQLKNQDPLDPLDTEKFTSQLVEFASVEQSIRTNKHLETLIGLQAAADRDGAFALIGRTVTIDSDKAASLGSGANWSYDLPNGAATVRLSIVDAAGKVVAQIVADPRAGVHEFKWDGKRADGSVAPNGVYRLIVDARDASGGAAPFTVTASTKVSAVVFGAQGPQLETPVGPVALASVRRVNGE